LDSRIKIQKEKQSNIFKIFCKVFNIKTKLEELKIQNNEPDLFGERFPMPSSERIKSYFPGRSLDEIQSIIMIANSLNIEDYIRCGRIPESLIGVTKPRRVFRNS
jgi:hypothetical protein